jgi:hypothetical protein
VKICATTVSILLTSAGAVLLWPAAARGDEFLAMPGLWQTVYEVDGTTAAVPGTPAVVWHCVDEAADPWISFAQLRDLPGMICKVHSQERTNTSLQWQTRCHGPGPETIAATIDVTGAIIFDSPEHYRGWVRFSGTLMGYPLRSGAKIEGTRRAACTSPAD